MEALVRLVYCSQLVGSANVQALQSMQISAARNNLRDAITGALLVYQHRVVQVLEGPRGAVSACFIRIANDTLHANPTLLSCGPIVRRGFDDWTMRLLPLTPVIEKRLSTFFDELDAGVDVQAVDRAMSILDSAIARSNLLPRSDRG